MRLLNIPCSNLTDSFWPIPTRYDYDMNKPEYTLTEDASITYQIHDINIRIYLTEIFEFN